ncbi:MAG: hypothetical protein QM741_13650 [Rudaea sp.]|uniref:hypothetical protein n=1 Tax=Rudaea sp. TaxID=2136325 RepID=UPI0039E2B1E4
MYGSAFKSPHFEAISMSTVTTRLSDVIVPIEFTSYVVANTAERTDFSTSGVMVPNDVITQQLGVGAESFTVPVWLDLGNTEANISNDDPDALAVPLKLSTVKQVVRKSFLNQAWSDAQLASELAGSSALARIQDRTAAYWARQLQRRLIASLNGVLGANVSYDAGDMVVDIHAATNAGVTASTKFNASSFIDTAATLGDALNDLVAVAVHSKVYSDMLKADLIQFLPNSQGQPIRTYRGLAVVVDDGLPYTPAAGSTSGAAAQKFTSVLFGRGAFGYGLTSPAQALGTEIFRNPGAGNGAGVETLYSRVNLSVHPVGHSWIETIAAPLSGESASLAGISPTLAELAEAERWDRVLERKAIPIAFLIHN